MRFIFFLWTHSSVLMMVLYAGIENDHLCLSSISTFYVILSFSHVLFYLVNKWTVILWWTKSRENKTNSWTFKITYRKKGHWISSNRIFRLVTVFCPTFDSARFPRKVPESHWFIMWFGASTERGVSTASLWHLVIIFIMECQVNYFKTRSDGFYNTTHTHTHECFIYNFCWNKITRHHHTAMWIIIVT